MQKSLSIIVGYSVIVTRHVKISYAWFPYRSEIQQPNIFCKAEKQSKGIATTHSYNIDVTQNILIIIIL